MTKILVTGGAGFIGSHLVNELLDQEYEVVVLDNLSTGRIQNIKPFLNKIKFLKKDVRKIKFKKIFKDIKYIFHLAANPFVPDSINKPIETCLINVIGTLNILEMAKKFDVEKVIFASSSSVYGYVTKDKLPLKEETTPNPISPYALWKLHGEQLCQFYKKFYGINSVCLRYFNVYGPNQYPDRKCAAVIPIFIKKILHNKHPIIYGDGSQSRDFVFVKDVVQANILAMKAEDGVYNVGSGKSTTINELINKINEILGKNIKPMHTKERVGDILHSCADLSKAKRELNYTPEYTLEEGLRITIDWFKKTLFQ
ncbi:MAG: SDR family oxidoreductase [Candidatus Parvarchaeota archaeon]|nr:SDR family oxidoreductase [Candidatus Jingweiarchaeum tengchongense]MCW1310753.1 SDR family oxidoreductase [Candidatus Jingweiarchaeum tengchongense]